MDLSSQECSPVFSVHNVINPKVFQVFQLSVWLIEEKDRQNTSHLGNHLGRCGKSALIPGQRAASACPYRLTSGCALVKLSEGERVLTSNIQNSFIKRAIMQVL